MTIDLNSRLSEHFKLWEFVTSQIASRQNIDNTPPLEVINNLQTICQQILEPAWNALGSIKILSGYYSLELNHAIGINREKDFSRGNAVEIMALAVSNQQLSNWLQKESDFDQIILTQNPNGEIASIYVSYSPTIGRKLVLQQQVSRSLLNVGRVPIQQIDQTSSLRDPYIQEDDALISSAEDFTISINTISDQLYKQYRDFYKAGQYRNDYFAIVSQMGLGDVEQPTLNVHYINHINNIDKVITSTWAENVAIIEDFQKDPKKSERLYLAFSSFCQGLGNSPLEQVLGAFTQVANEVGGVFPNLVPYTSLGKNALEGANYIINTILDAQYKSQVKTVEFTLYPTEKNSPPNVGEAPLQTGAYALFFEDVELESLQMDRYGTITSIHNEPVSPYIVVNIKKGIDLAPGKIAKRLAIEVLENFNKSYSNPLNANNTSAGYFDALEELGKTIRLSTATQRYFELKGKGNQLSKAETQRMTLLYTHLKENLINFD